MLKKTISIIVTVIMCFSLLSVTAFAYGASTYDITSAIKSSSLDITGGTATCISTYNGVEIVKSVKIAQSFEKHSYLWVWDRVGSEITKTETDVANMSSTSIRTGITSGTYRVKSVFTVTLYDGRSETFTVYSQEVTV